MAFGQPNYPYFNSPGYQSAVYPQPVPAFPQSVPAFQQRQEQPAVMQQPGMLPARYVTGREEAVAAQIIPGDPFIFADFQRGRIYVKQINPQTMAADFIEFDRVQTVQAQEAPAQTQVQFATKEDLEALKADMEAIRASIQLKTNRKAVNSNDE